MDVFKDQWEKQVRILTEAVDDITSVDDFLSVSGTRPHSSNRLLTERRVEECLQHFFISAYTQAELYSVTCGKLKRVLIQWLDLM